MTQYIIKRILSVIPVLLIVSIIVFSLIHLAPGNPATVILGSEAPAEEIEKLTEDLGLHLPWYQQYFNWLGNVLVGDFGESIFMRDSVLNVFIAQFGPTLSLSILALIISIIISLPLGIIAATKRGTFTDQSIMGFSLLGISIPSFLLGLFLMLIFSVKLGWFPVGGYSSLSNGIVDYLKYLILPAIALGFMQAGLITRMTRSSMIEVLSHTYINTARSKGLKESVVIYKHALQNALIPILEVSAQTFSALLAGAVVVEFVFNIPGIGQLIVNALERRDFPVIQGIILIVAGGHVFINLIVDLLYGIIDPRIRYDDN